MSPVTTRPERVFVIGLDVDSTLVTHEYPDMGEDLGAVPWLRQVLDVRPDVRVMLCTMRDGANLDSAKSWLEARGVPVWAMNAHPDQALWTSSPKPYAHLYIDDRGIGVPLRKDHCVDWIRLGPMLRAHMLQ